MDGISGPDGKEPITSITLTEEPKKEESQEAVEAPKHSTAEDREERMKAEEELHRSKFLPEEKPLEKKEIQETPEEIEIGEKRLCEEHLTQLDAKLYRISQKLKIEKSREKHIELHSEAFKLVFEKFQFLGGSIDHFIQVAKKQGLTDLTDNEKELIKSYSVLSSHNAFLELYALEKQLNIPCLGKNSLFLEVCSILSQLGPKKGTEWNHYISRMEQVVQYLEEDLDEIVVFEKNFFLKGVAEAFVLCYFYLIDRMPEPPKDLGEKFLPFIFSHLKMKNLEKIVQFSGKEKDLDKAKRWVQFHLTAAATIAEANPEKAKAFVAEAKEEVKKLFWSYPWPRNKPKWEATKSELLREIAQVEENLA